MNGKTRLTLAAVAVVAVVVGGLYILRPGTDRPEASVVQVPGASASPAPSDSASPEASIPAMSQAFTSPRFGYSIRSRRLDSDSDERGGTDI